MTDCPERGHRRKIRGAIEALDARGLLPPYLRTVERDALVFAELVAQGYGNAMPSRWSIRREFIRMGRSAPNARRLKALSRVDGGSRVKRA
jgi:hypothetical protein